MFGSISLISWKEFNNEEEEEGEEEVVSTNKFVAGSFECSINFCMMSSLLHHL